MRGEEGGTESEKRWEGESVSGRERKREMTIILTKR